MLKLKKRCLIVAQKAVLAIPAVIWAHLHGPGLGVCAHQEHLHGAVLLHGQWQREVAERVKGDRDHGALRTH